jgi:hypothetical protein
MDDWRSGRAPAERLAALAADIAVPLQQRREAAEILGRVRSMAGERLPPPGPMVRMLGLLMLVPAA